MTTLHNYDPHPHAVAAVVETEDGEEKTVGLRCCWYDGEFPEGDLYVVREVIHEDTWCDYCDRPIAHSRLESNEPDGTRRVI